MARCQLVGKHDRPGSCSSTLQLHEQKFFLQVMEAWLQSGALANLQYINLDTCDSLNEASLTEMILRQGPQLQGLCLGGHHKLLEYFWMNMIPQLKNIRVIVMGIAEDCCAKVAAKIHVDQFIECIAQNCPRLTRLEIRWDDDTLRFSDKSRSDSVLTVFRNKPLRASAFAMSY
ncbi:hypothetical protein OESDEN_01435 [Oesophagostomum dentatum]|uniref:Leucine Rich repeat-containing domain protein n=1 Tax=Oesophagostomum dentatum TaxID=61180 RepID=A0A0B1TT36_OESDE|nr:hypothetical protein OESDEN_01435 [Oesophagostomum dentatum]